MRIGRLIKVVGLIAGMVVLGAALTQAAPGGGSDPDDSANFDIAAIGHDNTATVLTFTLDTFETFGNPDLELSTANWFLDLNSNGATSEPNLDGCMEAQGDGTSSGVSVILTDCSGNIEASASATKVAQGAGTRLSFSFPLSAIQSVGLATTATSFQYFVTANDFGDTDRAPDTGFTAFSLAVVTPTPATPTPTLEPTPTPTPEGTVVTDNQTLNASVQGVLSINALLDSVNLGTITGGQTGAAVPVGEVAYTNTLNDGLAWTVSVAATKLQQGSGGTGKEIAYSNLSFAPGQTVTKDAGSTADPTLAAATPVAFSGSGTFSNPVGLASAPGTTQGSFHQTGSTVQLAVPLTTQAGAYTGTLQYTIIG